MNEGYARRGGPDIDPPPPGNPMPVVVWAMSGFLSGLLVAYLATR